MEVSQLDLSHLQNLQKALLPRHCPHCTNMPIAVRNVMKYDVGGDFYEFTRPDTKHWGFLVGDATGHGITAAAVAAVSYGLLQHLCKEIISPGEVLSELNEGLYSLNTRVKELAYPFTSTMFYGVLNTETGSFFYANAGHPSGILFGKKSHKIKMLEPTGPPLGFSPNWKVGEVELSSVMGTQLIIFTDGLLSMRKSKNFDLFEMKSLVSSLGELNTEEMIERIWTESEIRADGHYDDDATIIVVDFLPISDTLNSPSKSCPINTNE